MKLLFCDVCGKKVINDEIALNLRLRGRGCSRFLCISCLAKGLGQTEESVIAYMQVLKMNGCELFEPTYV